TVFSVSANFTNNFGFSSNNVRSVFAVVDAPPATGTQAVVSTVFTDASGRVTGVSFSNGGNYTGDADGFVNIAITSLDGGSGASIRVALAGNSSVSTAYGTPANVTITAGSGYPANSNNFTLNKTGSVAASYQSYTYIQKGTVSIANGDYGTGVSRPKQVQ
ncbi:MAG: hypothetical protein K2U26_02505, partial [Cyclobacteriaceae bacterium]|nr:hypothetical protein [Acetobacteraceae bacterium]MBY0432960.1 hypothetical protein [Cyclobacteriaceae bacterium]